MCPSRQVLSFLVQYNARAGIVVVVVFRRERWKLSCDVEVSL